MKGWIDMKRRSDMRGQTNMETNDAPGAGAACRLGQVMRAVVHTLLVVLALAAIARPVAAGGARERGLTRVVIGYQAIPNGELVAKQLGWHEETLGVPVHWVQFNSGSELNAAIAAGSVDLGLGGSSTTVVAIAQGVPARVIWIHNIIGENEALVVRRGSDIRTVADLRGRTVSAPFGATTHYHLLTALQLAGVEPAELRVLDMPPTEMLAAWLRGDIDAGFVWEPTLAAMLEADGRVLVSSGELAAQGFLTGDIGIARTGFLEQHPDIVVQYLRNQMRAVTMIQTEPNRAAAAIAAELSLDGAEARRQMDSLVFLDAAQQLSAAYLGRDGAPGELAEVFLETGRFLAEQDTIQMAPDRARIEAFLAPEFLQRAAQD
ncbi:MAG: glycine/betaine ABC transporter substrate-binding protein [Spirochaetaceae bacterium]|nr:MAG: glycine/betaine ABC transporter substrate-binding protein [Spirochaetaceae bacterium]